MARPWEGWPPAEPPFDLARTLLARDLPLVAIPSPSPAPQFPELQHQFEQILCGHRYRLRRPQTQPPLIACPRHEFRHGPLCGFHHIHWLFHHFVASFRMAATLPRITHREPTPIVIGKNVEGFNPWAG